jgi:hypothetical protein
MEELFGRAREAWEPLRAMAADNIAFHADSPSIMLAVLLDGWSNLDVPYGRAAGIVTLDRLEQVEAALEAIERDPAYKDVEGIDPGLAWLQLCAEAARLLFPPREVLKAAA